jgi:hypothetical protein
MGFDMTVWLPCDPRYVATARLIATESVKEAGAAGAPAEAFVGQVEDAARTRLVASSARPHVTMAVRREPGALVVTLDNHAFRLAL